jgi:hypothetical protein
MSNGGPAHVPRGDLTRYCDMDFDFAMPEGAATCDVGPGSVLFIPRGYWHMTESSTDLSWSISFALHRPTWLEVVECEIRKRLVQLEHWRQPALPSWGRFAGSGAARRRLVELLGGFDNDLGTLDADAMLGDFSDSPADDFRRWTWVGDADELETDDTTRAMIVWIRSQADFDLVALRRRFPVLGPSEALRFVDVLREIGALELVR